MSSCLFWNAGTFWQPCASGHGDRHLLCLWRQSILGSWWLLEWTLGSPSWSEAPLGADSTKTNRLQDADPVFFGARNSRLKNLRDDSFRTLSMAPLDNRASTACWRSWGLFLERNAMLWRVSWSQRTKVRPTPSLTVLVARQVPSKFRYWWAMPARQTPPPETRQHQPAAGAVTSLAFFRWNWGGTILGSPADACTKGLSVLGDCPLDRCWLDGRPQAIKDWGPGLLALLAWGCLLAGLDWNWNLSRFVECHIRTSHPVSPPAASDMLLQH